MKICAIADLHGYLPNNVPDCDLLLLGGDICPNFSNDRGEDAFLQADWLNQKFLPWTHKLFSRGIDYRVVAGNHCWAFYYDSTKGLVRDDILSRYLEDSSDIFGGFKIYGSPWQREFHGWAFNLPENKLDEKWAAIPADIDILLLHGPPFGYGDLAQNGRDNLGSPGLTRRIHEVKPELVVCGHIHSGAGIYRFGDTVIVNGSFVDEHYNPTGKFFVVDIEKL